MLPFYRYMVIWRDLYSVFGGFVTWTYEGLGIVSFTNELWNDEQSFGGRGDLGGRAGDLFFDDRLLFGAGFVDWHEVEHPLYGRVEVGGFKKDVGRVPPTFLIEEMLHRNAAFAIRHAEAMPRVAIAQAGASELGGGVRAIDVVFRNERAIPTRTALAARDGIGVPDVFWIDARGGEVLAGGFRTDRFRPERIDLAERDPSRLVSESGIPGRGEVRVRWFVRGGGAVTVGWRGEKARAVEASVAP
jgi:hypothetical protein